MSPLSVEVKAKLGTIWIIQYVYRTFLNCAQASKGVRKERKKGGGLGREGFLPLPVSVPLPPLRLPRRLTPG